MTGVEEEEDRWGNTVSRERWRQERDIVVEDEAVKNAGVENGFQIKENENGREMKVRQLKWDPHLE